MKPLIVVTCFNRLKETKKCLFSLALKKDRKREDVVLVNNGSTDGTVRYFQDIHYNFGVGFDRFKIINCETNVGTSRALNHGILNFRIPGQPLVKIDNDMVLKSKTWIQDLLELEQTYPDVGMISGYYGDATHRWTSSVEFGEFKGKKLWKAKTITGHCVWHTGSLMDKVKYFDVLSPEHLYGFEDTLMSIKANVLGMKMLIWEGFEVEALKTEPALGVKGNEMQAQKMQKLFEERANDIKFNRKVECDSEGKLI